MPKYGQHKNPPWTQEELKIILDNYENMSVVELENLLPGRTRKAIQRKIEKLRVANIEGLVSKTSGLDRKEAVWKTIKKNEDGKGNWNSKPWKDKW